MTERFTEALQSKIKEAVATIADQAQQTKILVHAKIKPPADLLNKPISHNQQPILPLRPSALESTEASQSLPETSSPPNRTAPLPSSELHSPIDPPAAATAAAANKRYQERQQRLQQHENLRLHLRQHYTKLYTEESHMIQEMQTLLESEKMG
jgi:hypothetical protein